MAQEACTVYICTKYDNISEPLGAQLEMSFIKHVFVKQPFVQYKDVFESEMKAHYHKVLFLLILNDDYVFGNRNFMI